MEIMNLEDCCEILDSMRIPITESDREEGKYPYYGANGIQDYVADYIFDDELVLLAEDGGNFGSKEKPIAYRVSGKCWVNNHAHVLKPKASLNVDYLCYSLMFYKVEGMINGATRQKLTQAAMRKMKIPLRSMKEQVYIVEQLNYINQIKTQRQRELKLLENLIRARFVEMFGDPNINSKKWNECPLSKKLNVLGGYAFKSDQFDEKGGIPVLRIGNINAGYFKPVNMVYWQKDESLERYVMYPGDLVMSLTGTVGKDDYGNVCILDDDYEMYYLNQRNAKLEIKEGIDKYYLSQLLKFEQIKKRLTGISRGVRQANISNKDILNLVVPIPPLELQNQFADFVKHIDKSKLRYQLHTHTCQPNTS
ncbi:restriction endonuclease subunit S [Clostridium sp. MCC344]|nr:restriction endonuclease subunit S [Clostridium sp. MCC344]MBS7001306.1 restriction endonuclease subunit S [Clostridiaceae bacterium]MBT9791267.1 restriction endonuclease subunit S [Clostridium sp. MCC344]